MTGPRSVASPTARASTATGCRPPGEMVDGGPIDVLTGDWLAELTMLILWKSRQRDPSRGYARTFLTQMEEVLGTCVDRGIKVVTNAGRAQPGGPGRQRAALADKARADAVVAHVEGDDSWSPGIAELQAAGTPGPPRHRRAAGRGRRRPGHAPTPIWAAGGIAEALAGGADVVV